MFHLLKSPQKKAETNNMAVSLIQLLQTMVKNKGSDLHVAANSPPMIRVRGEMVKLNVPNLTAQEVVTMIEQITDPLQKTELTREKNIDFSFKASGVGIFRVNVFNQRHGLSIVMRVLTEAPPTMEELKLPEICRTACSYANGLVLVTGPTGSGKSTTLAAMLNYINMTTKGHILTLEDPIEFQHESKLGMVNQRALGLHFVSFASAMKAALREDPDVILVGEMRDAETVALALKAAETGHLVFSTLHTNSAAKTIDRVINTFPAEEQPQVRGVLAESLKLVISQKLVPSADKTRRICFQDIFVNTIAAGNLIREGKTFQLPTVMQTGKSEGMQLLDQVLFEAVKKGEVTGEDGWEYANDKAMFNKWSPKAGAAAAAAGSATGAPASPEGAMPGTPSALKKAG
jgi:twitching motility protein PilT